MKTNPLLNIQIFTGLSLLTAGIGRMVDLASVTMLSQNLATIGHEQWMHLFSSSMDLMGALMFLSPAFHQTQDLFAGSFVTQLAKKPDEECPCK